MAYDPLKKSEFGYLYLQRPTLASDRRRTSALGNESAFSVLYDDHLEAEGNVRYDMKDICKI
jgi:hypothetical protein